VRTLARAVSVAGHPFVTMLAFGLLAGGLGGAAGTSALAALAVVVPIALLAARQRRAGRWETVDASRPRERPALYAVGGVAAAFLLAVLLLRGDVGIARELGAVLLLLAVAAAANRRVKTSLHVAFAALAATALLRLGSPAGWVLAAATPAIAWSRLHLERHTVREVLAGAALGVVAGALPGLL
jgi:membrane-associated phospholipid phosphatase